jgi:hypothetical protein
MENVMKYLHNCFIFDMVFARWTGSWQILSAVKRLVANSAGCRYNDDVLQPDSARAGPEMIETGEIDEGTCQI